MAMPTSKPWHIEFGISAQHYQEHRGFPQALIKGGYSPLVLRTDFNLQADG